MPTKEAKILATDLNSYYTRLNQIRAKFGLAQVTYSTVTSDTKATSQQAKTLKSAVDTVKSSTKYLNSVTTWEPGTSIDQGQPIATLPFVTLDTTLDNMMAACPHDSVNSTHGNFSDFSTNGTCSTNSTCGQRTNAVNDNFSTRGNNNNSQWGSG